MEYNNQDFDEERALYGIHGATLKECNFKGPSDGESALKECSNIYLSDCYFELRYPLWHASNTIVSKCEMTNSCRAAMWYDENINIEYCKINGIKAIRECNNVSINNTDISSVEFGWKCHNIEIKNCSLVSEYPFLDTENIIINQLNMKAKYAFQYVRNMTIRNSALDTKDAFWHSKDVTVYDSIIKGEYLGWYSENLKLVRCRIIGTQPLCYCKNLILEDCEMDNTDLSFELSEVRADVRGEIESIKNPLKGYIRADSIGNIIIDEHASPDANCDIIVRNVINL